MSSATSTNPSTGASGELRPGRATETAGDSALRPWQFFLLAGMLCATAVVIVATGQSAASIIILSLTVVAASFVALGTYRALAPLVLPQIVLEASALIVGRSRGRLEREKALVLRTIKELEFDFAMGKIARTDYDEMGGRLRARAIGLIRQLDASGGYRGAIEQELQSRAAALPLTPPGTTTPRSTIESAESAVSDASIETGACVSCGVTNDPDARFCKSCGTRLTV